MSVNVVLNRQTNQPHLISGETPGWAYCTEWIQDGEALSSDHPVPCRACAAMDDRTA